QIVLFLLLCAVALGWIARHFRFPYPIALVIGGGALGFVPNLPELPLDPQFILALVLPPILYQAALLTSWRDFKVNIRPIGLLAIGLVIVTTLAVGAAFKMLVPDVPWAVAFVLGAIVSPPDAVAATTILSRLNIPRRVVTILEGESLVNDASGLVIYKFAVAAVMTGAFSLFDASVQFVEVAAGGIAIGVAMAMLFVAIHRRLGDVFIEVLTTLTVPYVAYILAESLHMSGVLAVVAAGLVRGRYAPEIVSAETRIIARSVWNLLVFLLNSLVFMLIGLQLSEVTGRLASEPAVELIVAGVLISTVAILVRFAWIYPATWLPRLASARYRASNPAPPEAELFIMSWCGMRGIVSLAAALALPLALADGTPFPYRDIMIFFTFVIIAVTLVLQGLTLPVLIRKLRVGIDWSLREEQENARNAMSKAAIAASDVLAERVGVASDLAGRISAEFAEKNATGDANASVAEGHAELARRLRHAAINAERQELIRIWRENQISDDVLHEFEEELDYKESHL
ncbi:MAG: Na+/H+ antiporter, partial [Burkholderiales bacterium]|nr:Na+/H+ antiporter [Burkholderiales bacterium]